MEGDSINTDQIDAFFAGNIPLSQVSPNEIIRLAMGNGFNLVTSVIVLQFVFLFLLMLYAFFLRWQNYTQKKKSDQLREQWQQGLMGLLGGEKTPVSFTRLVSGKSLRKFGEFIRPYLIDFDGEEKETLVNLLYTLKFDLYLQKSLKSKVSWRRGFAAHYLGLLGDRKGIPELRNLLSDQSEFVMYAAAESLMQLQDSESVYIILTKMEEWAEGNQDRMAQILFEFGPSILPELLNIIRVQNLSPWIITILFGVFRYHHFVEASPVIMGHVMTTQNRQERLAGLRALAEMEQPHMADFFYDLLIDKDRVVRSIAASALSLIGDEEHVPRLVGQLFEDDFWVVKHSIDALLALGESGVDAICREIYRGELPAMTNKLVGEAIFEGRFEL